MAGPRAKFLTAAPNTPPHPFVYSTPKAAGGSQVSSNSIVHSHLPRTHGRTPNAPRPRVWKCFGAFLTPGRGRGFFASETGTGLSLERDHLGGLGRGYARNGEAAMPNPRPQLGGRALSPGGRHTLGRQPPTPLRQLWAFVGGGWSAAAVLPEP